MVLEVQVGENSVAATKELLMEPTLPAGHGELCELRLDLLRRAIEIYLGLAYPGCPVPDAVQRRLVWREDCRPDELLAAPPFERTAKHRDDPRPSSHFASEITATPT